MKNHLIDLNNHLFAEIERLGDEDLTPDQIETEVCRAGAIVKVSDQIISNANLVLKAAVMKAEHGIRLSEDVPMIEKKQPITLTQRPENIGDNIKAIK